MAQKLHQCSLCQKTFSRPSKLHYHIAYHHDKKFSFECTQCGKAYSNQDHVNRHYRTAHQTENSPNEKFSCKMQNCLKTFANKQNLHRHKRIAHLKDKIKARQCFYCSNSVDDLETHLIHQHQSISKDKLRCLDCSKEYSSLRRLVHHRIIHTDERRLSDVQWTVTRLLDEIERNEVYQCDLCDRIFRSLYQLDQHRHSQIHQKQFHCPHSNCRKTFLYMRNLRQHQQNHHENLTRLPCPVKSCSKTYASQSSIDRHMHQCHSALKTPLLRSKSSPTKPQANISSLLSGFDSRKLRQDKPICHRMKSLFDHLLTDTHAIDLPDEKLEQTSSENSFDSNLLKGYEEIGLVTLF